MATLFIVSPRSRVLQRLHSEGFHIAAGLSCSYFFVMPPTLFDVRIRRNNCCWRLPGSGYAIDLYPSSHRSMLSLITGITLWHYGVICLRYSG